MNALTRIALSGAVALSGLSLPATAGQVETTGSRASADVSELGEVEAGTTAAPSTDAGDLHVASHVVSVVINNGFATTRVEQVLVNSSARDVETEWGFPLPEEASLSELSMRVGDELVVGEVVEKAEARRIYAAEKAAGETAATAEQNGFLDYRIALSRVPAGGEIAVRIVYYQPLDVDAGVGRYLYPLDDGGTAEDLNASFWTMGKDVRGEVVFDVTLEMTFPVDGLYSPSHPQFAAQQVDEDTLHGRLALPGARLDRDFVLLYRLSAEEPARVELLTHRAAGEAEGTFLAVITPGSDLESIEHGTDWVFVLDSSGSMRGDKIRALRRGVEEALKGLRPEDRFLLIDFDERARRLTRGFVAATPGKVALVAPELERLEAGGGTNILAALEEGYDALDADRATAVVLVSDGVANLGRTEYREFVEVVEGHDVRLFTFVMGNGANERLLGDLATLSGGFAKSVSVRDEVGAHLLLARDRMSHEALHGTRVELDGAVVMHPKRLPSLYLGQQLVVAGRYAQAGPSELRVSARISGEERTWRVPVDLPAVDEANPELERIYGLAAIADLERQEWLDGSDEGETRDAIVDMGVRYSLVTDHTSMVVVRDERKAAYGLSDDNARRRGREEAAAARRAVQGNAVQVRTGSDPLGGGHATHAPSRASRGGVGAFGPLDLAPVLALALLAFLARREAA